MNRIEKILATIFIVGMMIVCLCGCTETDYGSASLEETEFITDVQGQVVEGIWGNMYVYTFTNSENGKRYIVCNCDEGVTMMECDDNTESEYDEDIEW